MQADSANDPTIQEMMAQNSADDLSISSNESDDDKRPRFSFAPLNDYCKDSQWILVSTEWKFKCT